MDKFFLMASSVDANVRQCQESMLEPEHGDASLDEALGFTFPASDPVALNFAFCRISDSPAEPTSCDS